MQVHHCHELWRIKREVLAVYFMSTLENCFALLLPLPSLTLPAHPLPVLPTIPGAVLCEQFDRLVGSTSDQ